jgi:hypothetical protein
MNQGVLGPSNHFTFIIFPHEYDQFVAIVHSNGKSCTHLDNFKGSAKVKTHIEKT